MRLRFLHRVGEVETGSRLDPTDQIFSHRDTDGLTVRHFHVLTLARLVTERPDEWERRVIPIDRGVMRFVIGTRGIDEAHARRLPTARIEEPGLGCWMDDGSLLIVDGNHRLVKRVQRGLRTMTLMTCNEPTWRLSLLELPPELSP